MAGKTDLDYYRNQPDYDDFQEYLDTTPIVIDEKDLPKFVPDYSCAIIVDGIPIVSQDKVPKLYGVLLKIYGQTAAITDNDICMPIDSETGLSQGFCFIKFASKEEADNAIKHTNGLAIDKKHTFRVSAFSDLDVYDKIKEDDKPPALTEFHAKPEVSSWLTDSLCRDQFAMRYGKETEIYWANGNGEQPTLQYGAEREKKEGKHWCELMADWSPQGTYFVTYHKAGVKLWGGADFQPQGRFMHPSVEEISFSPCERYLITYRLNDYPGISNPQDNIILWNVRTGEKIKSFPKKSPFEAKFQVTATIVEEKNGKKSERAIRGRIRGPPQEGGERGEMVYIVEEGNMTYEVPVKSVQATQEPNKLKWSPDGNYVARLAPDIISVYELPSMNLLDRRSFNAKDIQDFSWSPRTNLLTYWSPANGNYPAVINIVQVPDRKEICTRKIVDVVDCKMVWQNDGDYLCVNMTKTSGKKKSYIAMFFRVKVAGVPVEQLEFTDPVLNAAWEPSGDRIAVLSGDTRSPQIAFYSMINTMAPAAKGTTSTAKGGASSTAKKEELTLLFTKTGTQCTDFQWSPAGGIVSLAYFPPDGCVFELFDVDNNSVLAKRNHERSTKLYWDPSGRYLASCTVTELRNINARGQPDDGINFYTFQGTVVTQLKKEKVFCFTWRPRPKDLLSPEEKKNILKNLKKYEKEFEKKDKSRKQEIQQQLQSARYKVAEEFLQWRNRNRSMCAALKSRRVALRDGYDSDDDRNYTLDKMVKELIVILFYSSFSHISFFFLLG
jgi:translation initiation factor 3 subunit B